MNHDSKNYYVRADAIEQVVMLELRRMAEFLAADEEVFVELLAQKTDKELLTEKKNDEAELQKAIARNDTVSQRPNIVADTRKGVATKYLTEPKTA